MHTLVNGLCQQMRTVGAELHRRGWVPATSGNFSAVAARDPYRLVITASGRHKGALDESDFLVLGPEGQPVEATEGRPSAEAALHLILSQRWAAGAILHTHSVWGTVLSAKFAPAGGLTLVGFEMLKAFAGVSTHEERLRVPVFANTQDIPALARHLEGLTPAERPRFGFLIEKHGLYTWGRDLDEARRHVEAFEFLFEVFARLL